jgi:hypothetical protein
MNVSVNCYNNIYTIGWQRRTFAGASPRETLHFGVAAVAVCLFNTKKETQTRRA